MTRSGAGAAGIPAAASTALDAYARLLATDPDAPTAVTDAAEIARIHIADSLSALELPELSSAARIADLGSGAGLPGLVIALVRPGAGVDLIEATGRKCEFLERAIEATGATGARVVNARAEDHARQGSPGREAYDLVTARAVGSLAELSELASPLLRDGGHLIAWKGARAAAEEASAERASAETGVHPKRVVAVTPYAGSRDRHLHVLRKRGPTPERLPRRPGAAHKRPFGG